MSATAWSHRVFAPLPTPAEMTNLDLKAQEVGIPGIVLMENAAQAAVKVLQKHWPDLACLTIYLLAGGGSNGGDAICMARYLADLGANVKLFLTKQPETYQGASSTELEIYQNLKLPCLSSQELLQQPKPDMLIDGLLGTGFQGTLRHDLNELVQAINAWQIPNVVAIDIPSGLDGLYGQPKPCAIKACLTITMHAKKIGLAQPTAQSYTGQVEVVPIGIPNHVQDTYPPRAWLITPEIVKLGKNLPANSYKNRFGHVLVIGSGQLELSGAGHLAAYAALRAGAGLVTCLAPKEVASHVRGNRPEIMLWPIGDATWPEVLPADFSERLAQYTSLVVGPGFGVSAQAAQFLANILRTPNRPPMVLDADGLKLLAKQPELAKFLQNTDIITPHPGEAAALLETTSQNVQANRLDALTSLAKKFPAVCILKGAMTAITLHDNAIFLSPWDIPQLAVGGAGDVLAGLLAALIGQKDLWPKTSPRTLYISALGVAIHALAGLKLAQALPVRGCLASEIANQIPTVLGS